MIAEKDLLRSNPFSKMNQYVATGREVEFGSNLGMINNLKCREPRDRIYAPLRLMNWSDTYGPPTPDYDVASVALVIDVMERMRDEWSSLALIEIRLLLEAVGVDLKSDTYRPVEKSRELGVFAQTSRSGARRWSPFRELF